MIQREWLYEVADEKNSEQHQYDSIALNGVDNSNPIITCYLNKDFYIFTDNSLKEVQEILLADTFDRIKEIYIPGLFKWLQENNDELMKEIIEIEESLNEFVLTEDNYNEYRNLLEGYKSLYEKAIAAYKAKSKIGGTATMGITIEVEELIEPGVYDATITSIDSIDGKYGPRLQVTFELPDGINVNGFFPPKATPNNKTGLLFEKALGELRNADSDELLGKTVKVLIEHVQRDGRVYTNVSKLL